MSLTSVINAMHHGQWLLLSLGATYDGMAWCPKMAQVQTAYRELLAAGST